jgi:hypothetical protein
MSVSMMCERALGLLNGSDLRDLEDAHRTLLENLNYDGLLADYAPREAVVCARHFAGVRDRLLSSHPWIFARKYAAPAHLSSSLPRGWKYAYSLPADCLKVLAVTQGDRRTLFRHYEVLGRNLMANAAPLHITYTAKITDTNLWDGLFADAFRALLAGELSIAIASDARLMGAMEQKAAAAVMSARAEGLIAPVAQLPFELPEYLDYSGVPTGDEARAWRSESYS